MSTAPELPPDTEEEDFCPFCGLLTCDGTVHLDNIDLSTPPPPDRYQGY